MQSEDSEDYPIDAQQHNNLSDKNSYSGPRSGPPSIKYAHIFDIDRDIGKQPKIRKPYPWCCPMHAKYNARLKRIPHYSVPVPFNCQPRLVLPETEDPEPSYTNFVFSKREITTIPEEVFHYKRQPKVFSSFKKLKAHKEKVASLKVVVGRLNEMCLEKPEVLQNKLPEEVMQSFSGIKI